MSTELKPYEIVLLNVEASYPRLYTPKPYKEGKPRYGCNFILREGKHDAKIAEIQQKIKDLLAEKKKKIKPENWCFFKADEQEHGPGAWEFRAYAKEERPPQAMRRDKSPALEKENLFYGGAIVDGVVHIYESFDKINGGLDGVRFVRDGVRKGSPPPDVQKALPDLPDDDDDGMA